jgi:hypothetical protein
MGDINKFDYIIQNPFSLLLYGIFFWFLAKWAVYAKGKRDAKKAFSFKEWRISIQWNLLVTAFAIYFMIAWDDEIIDTWFTGRPYERFSDTVYLLTAPIASALWYIISHFSDILQSAIGGAITLLTRFVKLKK